MVNIGMAIPMCNFEPEWKIYWGKDPLKQW
jgi:hypothetical protein